MTLQNEKVLNRSRDECFPNIQMQSMAILTDTISHADRNLQVYPASQCNKMHKNVVLIFHPIPFSLSLGYPTPFLSRFNGLLTILFTSSRRGFPSLYLR